MPANNDPVAYGVSEDCKYNCHTECRHPGCRCDCHQKARAAADERGLSRVSIPSAGPLPATGLEKYCPECKGKYPEDRNYCVSDGRRLSSLRCQECGNVAADSDKFCGNCGRDMSKPVEPAAEVTATDIELEAAALGPASQNEEMLTGADAEEAALASLQLGGDAIQIGPKAKVDRKRKSPISSGMLK